MVTKAERGFTGVAVVVGVVVVLVAVAGLALIKKQHANPSTTNNQTQLATLSGVVSQGPIPPTCSDAQPCNGPVANHTIQALNSRGDVVATTKTGDSGQYSFRLKPGHYILKLVPQVGSFASGNNEVDV